MFYTWSDDVISLSEKMYRRPEIHLGTVYYFCYKVEGVKLDWYI